MEEEARAQAKNKDLEDKILKENNEKDSEILQHINEKQALAAQCEELSKRLEDLQVAFDVVSKQLDVYKSETDCFKKENVALQQALASEKKSSQEWQTKYERAVPEFKLGQNLAREIQKSKDEEVKQLNEKLMKESGRLKSTEEGNEKLRVMLKSKNKEMGSKKEELQSREVEIGQLRRDIRRLKAEVEREKEKAMKMSEKFDRKEKERREIEDKLWRKSKELLSRVKEVERLHRQLQSKDEDVVRLKSNIKRIEEEEGDGDEKGAKPAEAASKLSDDVMETDSDEEDTEEKAKGVSKLIEIKSPNGSIIKKKVTVLVLPERKSERKERAKGGRRSKKNKDLRVKCPCGKEEPGMELIECSNCPTREHTAHCFFLCHICRRQVE